MSPVKDPVNKGLDKLRLSDSAIGRIFGVSRQSVGQWRKYKSIPRHYQRAFSDITGVQISEMLAADEAAHGINYLAYRQVVLKRLKEEQQYD